MNPQATNESPRWMTQVLWAAAVYNLAWGAWAIFFPMAIFRWAGFDPLPTYPQLWQCIGMIVGVYGVGYACAAADPVRHWPIILVGLLGKIFGPIGFVDAVMQGTLPPRMGWTILTNDLIWWAPFSLILWHAFKASRAPAASVTTPSAAPTAAAAAPAAE
ncbi:MAG: alkyl hydroperoxide reductase [Planctomycetota bacterium]